MFLYSKYSKDKLLPFEGPITDQPNHMIEIFNLLEQLEYEKNLAEMKKRK
jgi:hypothetical protein